MQVVQELPLDKAPSVDGYPAKFFKKFWPVIGEDVIKAVIEFFDTGKLLKEINCTTVTLVPKTSSPLFVKEYKLITCCTTLYKIIAKILTAKKMKLVVDKLVGPSQLAFSEETNVLDNMIIAYELINWYSQKLISPRCMIKVDIRKVYDSVEWSFLEGILEYGVPTRMVNLIMECVSTVSYSLLINGVLTPRINAKKQVGTR